MVDIAQVVCPKPVSSKPDAPPFPDYNLGINYTSAMVVDAPHIVSFIRASKQAVKVVFKIEDYYGDEVVPETTVELQELSDAVPSSCTCSNPTIPASVSATFGANYGAQCQAWDEPKCGELWGNVSLGEWCCRPWCYATSDCPDAFQSQAIPGQYFSYAACNTYDPVTPCQWTAIAEANDPCNCKNMGSSFNAAMSSKFPSTYGSQCGSWDMTNCATNYAPDQVDTWCCSSWCYVDKACSSALASLNPGMESVLYWSNNVCQDDPALMVQCPYKPQPNVSDSDTSCACLEETMPSSIVESLGVNASLYADYGKVCGAHDALICDKTYPNAQLGMWCCMSWCWVSETCPTSRASTVWPGHFWSQEKCDMDADAVSSCQYDRACECRGQLPDGTFTDAKFAADYGSSCYAWDNSSCKVTWGSDSDSSWDTSSDHEWCCDAWCYVNESCPIAKKSWLGIGFYFSYETCDDPPATYNEGTDTCDATRRLAGRQLAGRRRSGGGGWSSYSSYSAPRRRAPAAPATSPRRRSYSAPSAYSPRRRAPVSPRRRDVRRRAPPPPVPAPIEARRRTTSMDGNTYTTSPRRRSTDTTLRRRRSEPELPYGYASRPQMMNNYGGTMPMQTPYGYSGYNAVPAQKPANVAMYAAGGAVAGAVVGAGAMYAYNNMYSDSWGDHRRRRIYPFGRPNYCIVTAGGDRNGAFMECQQCYNMYGYSACPSANSCQTAAGCRYTTPQALSRDDLASTGFVPNRFTPPLRVTFTTITGPGINTDPLEGICPPETQAQADLVAQFNKTMSFKPELFLVLTQQQTLAPASSNPGCITDTAMACTGSSCSVQNSFCSSGTCQCLSGYCWSGSQCVVDSYGSVNAGRQLFPESSLLLCAVTAYAGDTWHMVDVAQVVCPKPTTSDPNAPAFPDYNLGIEYTSAMDENAPHIVTFIRSSQQAMTLKFRIEDYNGEQVVPETTITLNELSSTVPSTCKCTNPTIPASVSSTFGANYGTQCQAWDNANCGDLWGNVSLGAWCCRPWCYASSDCPDAYQSQALPGQYFSYAACNSFSPTSPCTWTAVAQQNDPCTCKNKGGIFSDIMKSKFALSYGSECGSWDMQTCATNYRPDQVDLWCCSSWCYVDKECPSAIASLNDGMEGILYWSDNVCQDDAALMVQCPYKPQPNNTNASACECLNETLPDSYLLEKGVNLSLHMGFGAQCAPHDAFLCDTMYPTADHDMWCCHSWCYVAETCPTARASTIWPGHFWSEENCTLDPEVVSACPFSSACECRGALPAGVLSSSFAANYGGACGAWDSVDCKATWGSDVDSDWDTSANHEWCCDSWCYVNESCPIAKKSWLGVGYYWSYETCDDSNATYDEASDTCTTAAHRRRVARRLELEEDADADEEEIGAAPRQLAGRRRSSSSWSSSSSRRRASSSSSFSSYSSFSSSSYRRRSPPTSSTSPRRRSFSAPSGWSPRRRAPVSPRRRDIRRRAPPPPVPAPINTRRRSTSLNGQTYVTTPRRRSTSSTLRRRRTIPVQPYGYSSRPQIMNNYGGTMPYQTSYGYSGYGAYQPGTQQNVAMYAAGGAVGGAVVGAGAMYAYNNMYGDAYGVHRRRYINSYSNMDWCMVTAAGSRNGAFMECRRCYDLYGFSYCPSARSCNTASGCAYTAPQSFNRDDLAATGFLPKSYTFPLRVIFTSITGQGVDTDPVTGICPPQTAAQADLIAQFNKTMSFKPDLFLVLTKQNTLREAGACDTDTTTKCTSSCWIDHSVCTNGICLCQSGYCWNGVTCTRSAVSKGWGAKLGWAFVALLSSFVLY
ncbi:unnamed protein product [Effrenium voratum]|nr:unnamed protein product [Effrenium voratum]